MALSELLLKLGDFGREFLHRVDEDRDELGIGDAEHLLLAVVLSLSLKHHFGKHGLNVLSDQADVSALLVVADQRVIDAVQLLDERERVDDRLDVLLEPSIRAVDDWLRERANAARPRNLQRQAKAHAGGAEVLNGKSRAIVAAGFGGVGAQNDLPTEHAVVQRRYLRAIPRALLVEHQIGG